MFQLVFYLFWNFHKIMKSRGSPFQTLDIGQLIDKIVGTLLEFGSLCFKENTR